jgi:hypothetical protein
MGFDCRKIRQGFCDYPGSVSGVTELAVFFNHVFITSCNCIRLVAAVITIGGGLPVFPGTASPCGVASALEESVSMVAALRGAKELRVTTTVEGDVYGVRRYGRRCFLRSWGGLIGAIPLSPPNFFEAIFLGGSELWCFRLACKDTRLEHSF